MENLLQDLRYAIRDLIKRPAFACVAVLTLGFGIGANTAIFSLVNAVVLKPLAFEKPDQLVLVYEKRPRQGRERNPVSPADFFDWRNQNQLFEHLCAWVGNNFNLTSGDEPERLEGANISSDFFELLKKKPALGRTFERRMENPGEHRVAILSHGLWTRRFGSDSGIVGKAIMLNGESYSIIGVMGPDIRFPSPRTDLWVPMAFTSQDKVRASHYLNVVGRLKDGVTLDRGRIEMDMISHRLEQQYPTPNTGHYTNVFPLYEEVVANVRPTMMILLDAVAFVLLIACANVANLLLARAASRRREFAVRTTLGATRFRLVRQLLTESTVLSLLGGGLGLLIAYWGVDLLVKLIPPGVPRSTEIHIDNQVLGFTLAVSILTGIVFGLVPALTSSRVDPYEALKESGARAGTGVRAKRARQLLVVAEVALTLVLLIGTGLMLKSFVRLLDVNLGFNPNGVLSVQLSLPPAKYDERSRQRTFIHQVLEQFRSIPGVQTAAVTLATPLGASAGSLFFRIDGRPDLPAGQGLNTGYNVASPDYFRTLGIPLVKGRDFGEQDNADSPRVTIINQSMARQFWPNEEPLGQRVASGGNDWHTIIGVVGDVLQGGPQNVPKPEMFWAFDQTPTSFVNIVIRAGMDPAGLTAAARGAARSLDKDLPLYNIKTLEENLSDSLAPRRFNTVLLLLFAFVSILLASVGIYGVISHSVSQRIQEIGVRMALGARREDVLRLVMRQGITLALGGVAVGLAAACALTGVLADLLFEVKPTDPSTFALVSLFLIGVAAAASYFPARRATRVHPIEALRYE